MNHVLQLHIPDTMNDWSLSILDVSVYNATMAITCPTLQVLLPGFKKATTINQSSVPPLVPGFSRHLTACDLGVQTKGCGSTYNCLPDGVYVIRYSVSPNDIVYVEYNHLRMVQAMKLYQKHLCDLALENCAIAADKKLKFDELMEIKGFLDSAKAKVEECHKPTQGMELYTYALKRLNALNCKTC